MRDARHAPPRGVEVLRLDALEQQRKGARVLDDGNAERLADGVRGDVVVRRPDAPRGEHVGVAVTQRLERFDDLVLDVRHDSHFAQIDADLGEVVGDVADILVLGPPGQDFVADDKDGSGHIGLFGHSGPRRG